MSARTAVTTALAAFVAVSLVVLVAGGPRPGATSRGTDATPAGSAVPRVVAYYFHTTMRCPTCLSIESDARAAIERAFPAQLADGSLAFHSLDMESPENAHFVTEFALTASSLVLVREDGGRVAAWKNLAEVWDLVGDDARFAAYVTEHTRELLGAS